MSCIFARRNVLGRRLGLLAVLAVSVALTSGEARAQESAAESLASAREKDRKEPLPPEDVSLKTTDDKTLAATFYPSRAGKEAAAVILLHDYSGNRGKLDTLARKLQQAGCAVIAPDLRGHGDSALGIRTLHSDDYAAMIDRDLESVKGFLMKRNNEGALNIERLGIVGVEMSASLAINWAALDWSWPELPAGKQGQDVKAVALVSPEWGFKGIRISDAVVDPAVRSEIAFLIVVGGRNARMQAEAKRLYNALARQHDVSLPIEKQMLFYKTPATNLQGMALVDEKSFDVQKMIVEFMTLRLVDPTIAWQMRKSPL